MAEPDFGSIESTSCAALAPDGGLFIGGSASPYPFLIIKLTTNGTIDSSFGINGKTYTDVGNGGDFLTDIALQTDGKIIAAGTTETEESGNFFVLRYQSNGKTDSSFGNNGKAITSFQTFTSTAYKILIQEDKNIIAIGNGYGETSNYGNFLTARYTADGLLDESYGDHGKTMLDLGVTSLYATGAFDANEKIVLAGYSATIPIDIMLARYNGDGVEKNKYVRIKHILHRHGITWEDKPDNLINYYSIQRSTNGNAFTEVARIFSKHNGAVQTYQVTDYTTANYRVASVSITGNITYSNTLTLSNTTLTIKLYPNPAKNNLQIEGLPPSAQTKLTVSDLSGNARITATANNTGYSLNIAQLTKGSYLLKIQTADEVITKSFIKE